MDDMQLKTAAMVGGGIMSLLKLIHSCCGLT